MGILLISAFELFIICVLSLALLLSYLHSCLFPINQRIAGIGASVEDGRFWLVSEAGHKVHVSTVNALFRTRLFILIAAEPDAPLAKQWLLILPDMVSPDDWRRLQVMTRWANLVEPAS